MSVKAGNRKPHGGGEIPKEFQETVERLGKDVEAVKESAAAVQESVEAVEKAVEEYTEDVNVKLEESAGRQDAAAALLSLTFQTQIKADRKAGTGIITDAMILQTVELVDYREHKNGVAYEKGDIVKSKTGLLFEVICRHIRHRRP